MGNLYYDAAKAAIVRMSFGMAKELAEKHVAVLALAPGFMGTERVNIELAKAPSDVTPGSMRAS